MKKTILVLLMVAVFATPCLANTDADQFLFSIEGTLWSWVFTKVQFGFYQGDIYVRNWKAGLGFRWVGSTEESFYQDDLENSYFYASTNFWVLGTAMGVRVDGWLYPSEGIGYGFWGTALGLLPFRIMPMLFYQVSDSWQPPE